MFKSSVVAKCIFMGFCYLSGWDTAEINHGEQTSYTTKQIIILSAFTLELQGFWIIN